MRRHAVAGGTFLMGLAVTLIAPSVRWLGYALLGLGVCWFVLGWGAISSRVVPQVRFVRGARGEGFALRFAAPPGGMRRRLKTDAMQLAADLHAYLQSEPPSDVERVIDSSSAAARDAPDEAARDVIWRERNRQITEAALRESQDLAARFGGRVFHVLAEFETLGLLDQTERQRIEWSFGSRRMLGAAAMKIEALARRL